jgi:S-adenosylmethionine decarboxylase
VHCTTPADVAWRWDFPATVPQERSERLDTFGRHFVCELSGCDPNLLVDVESIRTILVDAARVAKAEVRESVFHQFYPQGKAGVSGVVVLSESHISIHTWPESGYAAIDIYTCGLQTMPRLACEYVAERLRASKTFISSIERGIPDANGQYAHSAVTESTEKLELAHAA